MADSPSPDEPAGFPEPLVAAGGRRCVWCRAGNSALRVAYAGGRN